MKPTIHQRIKEVKDRIEIDLTEPEKKRSNLYLRIMVTSEYPELTLRAISDAFRCDLSTVGYYREQLPKISELIEYRVVLICFELGINPTFIPRKRPSRAKTKKDLVPVKQKMKHSDVKSVLDKDKSHKLWNKEISLWTEMDWESFYKLKSA